jgi:hypothetical protein
VFVLASVLLVFQGCEEIASESGILAVTVAGVVVGNMRTPVDRDLREFKDQLTLLLIGMLFVLLAADVRLVDVRALGWGGLGVVASLVLVVRPLGVWLSTAGSDLGARERAFVAWIAPRGIVAAAVASLTASALEQNGLAGGSELRALVFLTIATTVVLAGFTARPVASWLGQRLPARDGFALLGANGLSLVLAEQLRGGGRPVVMLDSNPHSCRRAEEAGFTVLFGNALEERTLQRARLEIVQAVIGLTPNEELNGLFVGRARELFGVPEGFIALVRQGSGVTEEVVRSTQSRVLFDAPHDLERWDVRARRAEIEIQYRAYQLPAEGAPEASPSPSLGPSLGPTGSGSSDPFVTLAVWRGGEVQPMSVLLELRAGDVVAIAVYTLEREEAELALSACGLAETAAAPFPAEPER